MCTETIALFTCGCFEVQNLDCCNHTIDEASDPLSYAICDEPCPSKISMRKITCAECSEGERQQYHQGRDQISEQEDLYDASDESVENHEKSMDEEPYDSSSEYDGDDLFRRYDARYASDMVNLDTESEGGVNTNESEVTKEMMDAAIRDFLAFNINGEDHDHHPIRQHFARSSAIDNVVDSFASIDLNGDKDEKLEKYSSSDLSINDKKQRDGEEAIEDVAVGVVTGPDDDDSVDGEVWFDAREQWQDLLSQKVSL
ncbi:hypothetical protein ONS95_007464 [Cadophora gregata]|uniref:uncharacterized protein n=1 Tax=Cadophora gregata TaxID=51156 RepID=UPI0026DC66AE|nr:uncharacterized protein ONS95_007464 [Cadophora gregata]KAK0118578.1 hypothetical protein ONS96_011670 [Cadophora gregata f. sp. sojae]KAK0125833.1 hypothetical protein ONS95_007464 [Cadophora gregata]